MGFEPHQNSCTKTSLTEVVHTTPLAIVVLAPRKHLRVERLLQPIRATLPAWASASTPVRLLLNRHEPFVVTANFGRHDGLYFFELSSALGGLAFLAI
jgi:hypothetical protein